MKNIFKYMVFVIFNIFSTQAYSYEYRLLDVEQLDISYQKFEQNRDPYAPEFDQRWLYRASTNIRISILESFYWDNKIHTEALDTEVVKTVGWHWVVGFRVNQYVDVFKEHHSRHVMEEDRPTKDGRNIFPVEDSYGIRFKVIERGLRNERIRF